MPTAAPLLPALAVLAVGVWGFGALSEDVFTGDPIVRVDQSFAAWLHGHGASALTTAMKGVTTLGSAWVLVPLAAIGVAWPLARRRWAEAGFMTLAVLGAEVLTAALKAGFERRPD